jgi:hypothetical protein
VLPPKIDYDALGLLPLQSPVATRAEMSGERAYAERAPSVPEAQPEETSASEAAAAAVIERLEAILAEPTAEAPAESAATEPATTTETPAQANTPEPSKPSTLLGRLPPIRTVVKRRDSRATMFGLVFLGLIGVALIALAAMWGFQPEADQVLGVSPRTAGLTVGLVGVACFGAAAYFILERLGRPRGLS